MSDKTHVFLGGRDLEMRAIAHLLNSLPHVIVYDRDLAWGARASDYLEEIRSAIVHRHDILLVELTDDLPGDLPRERIRIIDHHGPLAGRDQPTSIEQLFRYFDFPREMWTRDLDLIAANDRGHIQAMVEMGASVEEISSIRARDRLAQGITPQEEAMGLAAIEKRESHFDGRLTVVELPHSRTATVTDPLDTHLGGPGYQNLLVLCPNQIMFFGSGRCIDTLREAYPNGWYGGSLPDRGYWGCAQAIRKAELIRVLSLG